MEEITWVDAPPPKKPSRRTKWARIYAALREKPGSWALVSDASTANSAKTMTYVVSSEADFEASASTEPNDEGRYNIYARFVGK